MNQYSMVAFIVLVVMVTSLIRASLGLKRRGRLDAVRDDGAMQRMEAEMKQLKDRLAVLERITVEKENSLEREIEKLRDR